MKKIDFHCHTTNRKIEDTANESASLSTLKSFMDKYEIEKSVLLATYFPHKGSGISNFRLLNWIRERPEFLMFGSLDFENYFWQGMNELNELAEIKAINGIKIYTCYQNIDLSSDNFKSIVKLAGKYSLPLMFHAGYSYSSRRKYGKASIAEMVKASDLEKVAKENPGVNFHLSHMAKPFFTDLIEVINRNANITTDMSGLLDSKYNEDEIPQSVQVIKEFLEQCGPSKLLFGTDFPVQTHEHSVYMLEEAMTSFSEEAKQEVYYNNARRLLRC